jgi:serine/threonine protein kinase
LKALEKKDPESIGPFKLVARLGAGGMGVVYLATRGSQSVALKVLNTALTENSVARSRFKKEIQTLQQIDSPFVAKVVDAHADAETAWLAVEFVNGPDLKALVDDKGPLPLDQWITLADGLLSGIRAIHSVGVIHRDIKPGNILISETGPKIIDFGIAQDLDATSLTSTGSLAGSPAWLSPEQIDGATLTPASDLFSAGSVLHFAASGISPWGNQNTTTTSVVFNNILTKDPDTSMIPEPQKTLVDALLQKEVKSRLSPNKALDLLDSMSGGVRSTKIDNAIRNPAPKLHSTKKKTSEIEISIPRLSLPKKAWVAIPIVAVLGLGIFLAPSVLNPATYVCAETSYAQGNLMNSSFSALEESSFPNVLSRECKPNTSSPIGFTVEYCVARDPSVDSSFGQSYPRALLSRDKTRSEDMAFIGGRGKFGCRSFSQLGVMSEQESRLGALSFTDSFLIPFFSEDGAMSSGESRYSIVSDRKSGTFVTRYYASSRQDLSLALASPPLKPVSVDRIEYKSGDLPNWADSADDYVSRVWYTPIDSISPIIGHCYYDRFLNALESSGNSIRLEIQQSGTWVPVGTHEIDEEGGCTDSTYATVTLTEQVILGMTSGETCNEVRLVEPGVSNYASTRTTFCVFIRE